MILSLYDVQNLFPLFWIGVNTSRIMGANMQKNDGVVLCILEVFSQALKIKTFCVRVIITIRLPFLSNYFNKSSVKRPCRVWSEDVDIFVWVPISKE